MGHPLLDLTDKTAVVIGGTSNIGLALTPGLARAGANVVPTGRREKQVRSTAAEVVALVPGVLRTDMQRFGKPDELTGAAVFLASDAASFVTGGCGWRHIGEWRQSISRVRKARPIIL